MEFSKKDSQDMRAKILSVSSGGNKAIRHLAYYQMKPSGSSCWRDDWKDWEASQVRKKDEWMESFLRKTSSRALSGPQSVEDYRSRRLQKLKIMI